MTLRSQVMMSIRAILLAGLIAVVPVTDAMAQSRDRDRDRGGDRREQTRGYPSGERDRGENRGGRDQRGDQRGDPRGGRENANRGERSDRVNPGDVARRVQQNRPGRMLGVRETGGDYVVRWEYPGGRVSDIPVDGRSGRVRGD
jgi:hypothetical protein